MRFIKLGLISIVLLALLITVISFLLPSRIVVRRAVLINAPEDTIFKKVNDLQEWKHWLINRDTLLMAVSVENGKQQLKMGNTTIAVISIDSNSVNTQWRVDKGAAMSGFLSLINHNNTTGTTLQWDFEQNVAWYPWNKFGSIVSDKVLGPFMEQSLDNLRKHVEVTR